MGGDRREKQGDEKHSHLINAKFLRKITMDFRAIILQESEGFIKNSSIFVDNLNVING